MIRASIDLGTNTGLMLLAEVESGQIKKVLGDYARIIRLGEGVDKTRSLQPEAIGRTLMCLAEYKSIISGAGISPGAVASVSIPLWWRGLVIPCLGGSGYWGWGGSIELHLEQGRGRK